MGRFFPNFPCATALIGGGIMQSELDRLAMLLIAAFCLTVASPANVSAIAVDDRPSVEEGVVDRLAGPPDTAADLRNLSAINEQLPSAASPAKPQSSRTQYLTNTDYVVPQRSKMMSRQRISSSEISVYVAIGVLALIALALIIAGSVFCYKYSAALRAADRNDPGGRQPIVFGSQGSGVSSGVGSGAIPGDTKLAVHAQKSYYQRQKQNIASALKPKRASLKSPIQEEYSDLEDPNVYGCPGLASTSGLEVNNPIFSGPASDEE